MFKGTEVLLNKVKNTDQKVRNTAVTMTTGLLRHPCDIHGEPGPAPRTGLNFPHDSSISSTWYTPENGMCLSLY